MYALEIEPYMRDFAEPHFEAAGVSGKVGDVFLYDTLR